MSRIIEKVTAFVTRKAAGGDELALFRHPYAGIQIPAGTVEAGEMPEAAALREAFEETGLSPLSIRRYLGASTEVLPEGERVMLKTADVYVRPDLDSSHCAFLRNGITVAALRRAAGFTQVCYEEFDRMEEPHYVTMSLTGWVLDEALADTRRRHFFHLEFEGETADHWTVQTDHHHFTLFWAPLAALPQIVSSQAEWLAFLKLSRDSLPESY